MSNCVVDRWYRLPARACRSDGSGRPVLRCRLRTLRRRQRAGLVLLPESHGVARVWGGQGRAGGLVAAGPTRRLRCSLARRMAIEPSPTAEATRLTERLRTSPTANTPGRLA